MIVTYEIGSLGAELHLTLLSSRHGGVLHEGIAWRLESAQQNITEGYQSNEAQPLFVVTPGTYKILAVYQNITYDFGQVTLQQNTRADYMFIINTDHQRGEYFVEIDAVTDFNRRQQERELQSEHGHATLPLRDPSQKIDGDYGSQILAHPLLAASAQYDGVPPDMRPDAAENEAALELSLSAQLTNQLDSKSTPTPNPGL